MKQLFFLALLGILINNKSFSQTRVPYSESSKYIGQVKEIIGPVYKSELRQYKTNPDSAKVLLYIGDSDYPLRDFIIIVKIRIKGENPQAKWGRTIKLHEHDPIKKEKNHSGGGLGALGKIFLFEGKPAIMINYNDLEISEPAD